MRGSIKTLLACGALIMAGLAPPLLGAATPAAASAAASASGTSTAINGCTATVSNITPETLNGKAVLTFTGQVKCSSSAAQFYIHTVLYSCWNLQPVESRNFLLANCGYITNSETLTPGASGVTYTISDTMAAGNGYYAPVFNFISDSSASGPISDGTASGPIYGTPVLCSNGNCTKVTYAS